MHNHWETPPTPHNLSARSQMSNTPIAIGAAAPASTAGAQKEQTVSKLVSVQVPTTASKIPNDGSGHRSYILKPPTPSPDIEGGFPVDATPRGEKRKRDGSHADDDTESDSPKPVQRLREESTDSKGPYHSLFKFKFNEAAMDELIEVGIRESIHLKSIESAMYKQQRVNLREEHKRLQGLWNDQNDLRGQHELTRHRVDNNDMSIASLHDEMRDKATWADTQCIRSDMADKDKSMKKTAIQQDKQFAECKQSLVDTQATLTSLQEKLRGASSQEDTQNLQKQVSELKRSLAASQATWIGLKEKLRGASSQEDTRNLQKQVSELKRSLAVSQATWIGLKEKLRGASSQEDTQNLQRQVLRFKQSLAETQTAFTSLQKKFQGALSQEGAQILQRQVSELKRSLAETQETLTRVEERVKEALGSVQEIQKLQDKDAILNSSIARCDQRVDKVIHDQEELSSTVKREIEGKATKDDLQDLLRRDSSVASQVDRLKEQHDEIQQSLNKHRALISTLPETLKGKATQKEVQDLRRENAELKEQVEQKATKDDIEDLLRRDSSVKSQVDHLKEQHGEIQQSLKSHRVLISILPETLKEKATQKDIQDLRKENANLKEQVEKMKFRSSTDFADLPNAFKKDENTVSASDVSNIVFDLETRMCEQMKRRFKEYDAQLNKQNEEIRILTEDKNQQEETASNLRKELIETLVAHDKAYADAEARLDNLWKEVMETLVTHDKAHADAKARIDNQGRQIVEARKSCEKEFAEMKTLNSTLEAKLAASSISNRRGLANIKAVMAHEKEQYEERAMKLEREWEEIQKAHEKEQYEERMMNLERKSEKMQGAYERGLADWNARATRFEKDTTETLKTHANKCADITLRADNLEKQEAENKAFYKKQWVAMKAQAEFDEKQVAETCEVVEDMKKSQDDMAATFEGLEKEVSSLRETMEGKFTESIEALQPGCEHDCDQDIRNLREEMDKKVEAITQRAAEGTPSGHSTTTELKRSQVKRFERRILALELREHSPVKAHRMSFTPTNQSADYSTNTLRYDLDTEKNRRRELETNVQNLRRNYERMDQSLKTLDENSSDLQANCTTAARNEARLNTFDILAKDIKTTFRIVRTDLSNYNSRLARIEETHKLIQQNQEHAQNQHPQFFRRANPIHPQSNVPIGIPINQTYRGENIDPQPQMYQTCPMAMQTPTTLPAGDQSSRGGGTYLPTSHQNAPTDSTQQSHPRSTPAGQLTFRQSNYVPLQHPPPPQVIRTSALNDQQHSRRMSFPQPAAPPSLDPTGNHRMNPRNFFVA